MLAPSSRSSDDPAMRMMRFYLASGLKNIETAKTWIAKLEALGHHCTYNWTHTGAVWSSGQKALEKTADAELAGVCAADFVIVLMPGGRGTHVELGAALATRKKVFLVADRKVAEDTCAFYWHPAVVQVTTLDEILTSIR